MLWSSVGALFIVFLSTCAGLEGSDAGLRETHACFRSILNIECSEKEHILFDTARYGRNDTQIAQYCRTPFQRNCDVDVHFLLNRACAGKHLCQLAINTGLFPDPCGYEEFLRVTYRCVPANAIHSSCHGKHSPTFYDHGYIASPNYPKKYYMDAECMWDIAVQKRQTIRLTVYDFELDVSKGGICRDYLRVSSDSNVYFDSCGSQGKQVLDLRASRATLAFKTGPSSLTNRGFFVFFEAVGPGCPDLEDLEYAKASYIIKDGVLYANISCLEGYHVRGTELGFRQLKCSGSSWSDLAAGCVAIALTTPYITDVTLGANPRTTSGVHDSGAVIDSGNNFVFRISIALGVVSAILLITLLLVLALYFHRRRRNAERKLDHWRVVINNLQESAANEENILRSKYNDTSGRQSPVCNLRKARRKKNKDREDEWQSHNLLSSPGSFEEDEIDFVGNAETSLKHTEELQCTCGSRRNSRASKYAMNRSREGHLDEPRDIIDTRARSKRDFRHMRSKSGQFDSHNKTIAIYCPTPTLSPEKRVITRSAPDLLDLGFQPDVVPAHAQFQVGSPNDYPSRDSRILRSSTLGAMHGRSLKQINTRSNSRSKIRV